MSRLAARLPEHLRAIPIVGEGPVRACLVVSREADPAAGHLVALGGEGGPGRAYLGALLDADAGVVAWLELRVQALDAPSDRGAGGATCNALLDRAWDGWVDALERTDPGSLVRLGFERVQPHPTAIDLDAGEVVPLTREGRPLTLCTDEEALREAGLPSYRGTRARYLWVEGDGSLFVPVSDACEHTDATGDLASVCGVGEDLLAFNIGCGKMLARRLAPIDLEDYIDCLGGRSWEGLWQGATRLSLDAEPAGAARFRRHEDVFLYRHGSWGRLIEALYLKLRLLSLALRDVSAVVEQTRCPMLNLSARSFRVALACEVDGLPMLWAARPTLREPGAAVEIDGAEGGLFEASSEPAQGVYAPPIASGGRHGIGTLRIRAVSGDEEEGLSLEATLAVQERVQVASGDRVRLSLTLADRPITLWGEPLIDRELASSELRLRAGTLRLEDAVGRALRDSEGRSLAHVGYRVVTPRSTPCDLYALAVLGTRALLVDDETTPAVAFDELTSLARRMADEHDPDIPVARRVARVLATDERWLSSLGPHRLVLERISPERALDAVPMELWCEVLGLLVSMIPGIGPDSIATGFGDAPAGAPHAVFGEAIRTLDLLLERARSLMLVDWASNREIGAVIRRYLVEEGIEASGAG